MTQRDETGLRVPIEEAVRDAAEKAADLDWEASSPDLHVIDRARYSMQAEAAHSVLRDLIRRRDAGETHEVMF